MVALLFNTVTLPASFGTALRSGCRRVASSVKSIWRAHASHALRWPASETKIGGVSLPLLMLSFLTGPVESLRVRVRTFPLLFSATVPGFRFYRHPPPPNNSFKPTPHRGVNSVLYATLARCRRPAVGRLNSGVRRQKSVWWLCFPMLPSPASFGAALRSVSRRVASSVSSSGALTHRMRCVGRLRKRCLSC